MKVRQIHAETLTQFVRLRLLLDWLVDAREAAALAEAQLLVEVQEEDDEEDEEEPDRTEEG